MRKRIIGILLIMGLATLSGCGDNNSKTIAELENNVSNLQTRVDELISGNEELSKMNDELRNEIESLQEDVEKEKDIQQEQQDSINSLTNVINFRMERVMYVKENDVNIVDDSGTSLCSVNTNDELLVIGEQAIDNVTYFVVTILENEGVLNPVYAAEYDKDGLIDLAGKSAKTINETEVKDGNILIGYVDSNKLIGEKVKIEEESKTQASVKSSNEKLYFNSYGPDGEPIYTPWEPAAEWTGFDELPVDGDGWATWGIQVE